MPLRPVNDILRRALKDGYAVGYFESWNIESLQGVVDAAEAARSPVLVGVNGEFLSRPDRRTFEGLSCWAAMLNAAAASASVPCGLVFNECSRDDWVREAVLAGFGQVMPDDPAAPRDEFVPRVRRLAEFAHRHGAAIEAEVGHLPCGASGTVESENASITNPEAAARFVAETAVDMLSVSVGNVHVLVKGQRDLDLKALSALRRRVTVPFDLHGGTGISPGTLREAISMGVAKVCYGTCLKQRYLTAVRNALGSREINPHRLLGFGGPEDVMAAGRCAVRDATLERMEFLGCCGEG